MPTFLKVKAERILTIVWVSALFGVWLPTYLPQATVGVHAEVIAHLSPSTVGLMFALYGLALVLARIPIGILGSVVNQKKLMMVGLGITCLGLLIVPLASHAISLFISRIFLGIGTGFWVIYTVFYVQHARSAKGEAMAKISLAYGLGITLAGLLGGTMVHYLGWHAPFWVGAGLSAFALFLLFFLPNTSTSFQPSFSSKQVLTLIHDRQLLTVSFIAMVAFFAAFSTIWGLSQNYAYSTFQTSPLWLGVLAFAAAAAYTVAMRGSYWVRKKLGAKQALSLGLGVLGVATVLVPTAQNIVILSFLHACMGTGLGITYPILMSLSIEQETTSYSQTEAMGIFQSIYAVGIAAGPFLSGQLVENFGMESMFLMNGAVVILALLFVQLLLKQNANGQ